MTGLISGFGRGKSHFVGVREARHTPDLMFSRATIPLPTLIHDAVEHFKAALKIVVAAERTLDGPGTLHLAQRFISACTDI